MIALSRFNLVLAGLLSLMATLVVGREGDVSARNAAAVENAFHQWKKGNGTVFDLLAGGAQWTVTGTSPDAGVYTSREDLIERAVTPITAKLATPIEPTVRHIVAQGDQVVVLWDGRARAHDGSDYINNYAWYLAFDEQGRIREVIAYLDTWRLDQLMR
ncbi:nuclear transport factor 2 family protein [Pseudomonas sp. Marseille-QA0892]